MNPEFFRALEARRTRAIVERDLEAIEALHAPEYQLITPSGRTYSRTRYLEMIEAAPFYAAWEHGPMEVRVSVDMAVVRYQARITLSSGRVVECWHTDTYELREMVWLAVWSQATELPKAAPAA
jgi:phage baseplate assembly protein W